MLYDCCIVHGLDQDKFDFADSVNFKFHLICNTMSEPHIAILTPTKGRERHLAFQVEQMKRVDYPLDKITWIITDTEDPSDKGWQAIQTRYPSAIYRKLSPNTPLGRSRNIGLEIAVNDTNAEYIFLMDDDDIVNPQRFRKSVDALKANPEYNLVGCSAVLLYNLRTKMLMRTKEISNCHTLEPMTGFTREYARSNRFDDKDTRGLLGPFLGASKIAKWSTPILQMKAEDICVIIGHDANTFDKYQVESYSDRFGITEKTKKSLTEIYQMFGTDLNIRQLFEKGYKNDINVLSSGQKRKYMLFALEKQYTLEKHKDDADESKRITSQQYALAKKYIKKYDVRYYDCLQQIIDEINITSN
jgi:hypothetical protein